ncbi:hypothetical protein [Clostridium chromiireducens]|nr:hypothetical protein [Clostridium chromiireducens]
MRKGWRGIMSRCPFWSTARERVECYKECPIITSEAFEGKDVSQCIFNECTESNSLNFKEIIKEDYGFLNLSIYDEENSINVNY